jgi:hypothetical protein
MQANNAGHLFSDLVGSWLFTSYVTADLDGGNTSMPLGADATGLIIYADSGFMSVQIGAANRPSYADGALHGGTDAERADAARGYLAYAGTFAVSGTTVTHKPLTSLFPNWIAIEVPRTATIDGDVLTLDLVEPIMKDGVPQTGTLTWHRAPQV